MKKLLFVMLAGVVLSACGDDRKADAGNVGQGSMPADTTVIRVNQGAIATDLGGSTKRADSTRVTRPVAAPPPPLPQVQDTTRNR